MSELAVVRKEELTERDVTARYRAVLQQIEDGPISAEDAAANENMLAALEEMARRSGLVSETAQVELWLTRFLNRWRLGEALRKVTRGAGPGRGKKVAANGNLFSAIRKQLGLAHDAATDVQRLACMPWKNALAYRDEAREQPDMRTFAAAVATQGLSSSATPARSGGRKSSGVRPPPLEPLFPLDEERPAQRRLEPLAPIERPARPRMKPRRAAIEKRCEPLDARALVPQHGARPEAGAASTGEPVAHEPQRARPPSAPGADEKRPAPAVGETHVPEPNLARNVR